MSEEIKQDIIYASTFIIFFITVIAMIVSIQNNSTKVKLAEIEVVKLNLTTNGGCTPTIDKQSIEPEDNQAGIQSNGTLKLF